MTSVEDIPLGKCRYCQRNAGFLRGLHNQCQEAYVSAVFSILDMGKEAALHASDLDGLPDLISSTAAKGHVILPDGRLDGLLAKSWCNAVDEIIKERAVSTENLQALNEFRKHFGLTKHQLDVNGHFEVFRMMTLDKLLSDEGVVPRFDHNVYSARFGRLPFNLTRREAMVWPFRHVGYVESVMHLRRRLFRQSQYFTSMEETDVGLLGITTEHIYFTGIMNIFRIRLENIVSIERHSTGLRIMRDEEDVEPEGFTMGATESWFAVNFIGAVLNMEDITLPDSNSQTLDDILEKDSPSERTGT